MLLAPLKMLSRFTSIKHQHKSLRYLYPYPLRLRAEEGGYIHIAELMSFRGLIFGRPARIIDRILRAYCYPANPFPGVS